MLYWWYSYIYIYWWYIDVIYIDDVYIYILILMIYWWYIYMYILTLYIDDLLWQRAWIMFVCAWVLWTHTTGITVLEYFEFYSIVLWTCICGCRYIFWRLYYRNRRKSTYTIFYRRSFLDTLENLQMRKDMKYINDISLYEPKCWNHLCFIVLFRICDKHVFHIWDHSPLKSLITTLRIETSLSSLRWLFKIMFLILESSLLPWHSQGCEALNKEHRAFWIVLWLNRYSFFAITS